MQDPHSSNFQKPQQELLKHYLDLRDAAKSNPKAEDKQNLSRAINQFFVSLNGKQQQMVSNWFTYQLCDIDPLLISSMKIAEFAYEHNLQDHFAVTADGKGFALLMKSQAMTNNITVALSRSYPGLQYKIVEVQNV
jgi:hypothetical protein